MAVFAVVLSGISTNPKPLERPVSRSIPLWNCPTWPTSTQPHDQEGAAQQDHRQHTIPSDPLENHIPSFQRRRKLDYAYLFYRVASVSPLPRPLYGIKEKCLTSLWFTALRR